MRIRVNRSDGKTGVYSQQDPARAALLAQRFDPATLFCSGPIVIGMHNPFSIINTDEVCWIEVETALELPHILPRNIERLHRLADRQQYESLLARQWPGWMKFRRGRKGDPLEALIELSLRGGESIYLRAVGAVGETNLVEELMMLKGL